MASVVRCMRAAKPLSFSRFIRRSPPTLLLPARAFSASPIREIRRYTKEHEWVDLNADKTAGVIGISSYAAEELGDVVYVELPEKGNILSQGDTIGAVESVKSAADINAPIGGTVTEINMVLEESPATINKVPEDDSHGGGWICKIAVDERGAKDFEKLMTAEEYKSYKPQS